jgi:hypothetical protein
VTPYELELGLGARDWECFYLTTLTGKGLYSALTPQEFEMKLEKVRSKRVRSSSESTTDSDSASASLETEHQREKKGEEKKPSEKSAGTVALKSESAVTIFQSAASEYLSNREYKGLVPSVPDNMTTEIARGQYGIASSYLNTATASQSQEHEDGDQGRKEKEG